MLVRVALTTSHYIQNAILSFMILSHAFITMTASAHHGITSLNIGLQEVIARVYIVKERTIAMHAAPSWSVRRRDCCSILSIRAVSRRPDVFKSASSATAASTASGIVDGVLIELLRRFPERSSWLRTRLAVKGDSRRVNHIAFISDLS